MSDDATIVNHRATIIANVDALTGERHEIMVERKRGRVIATCGPLSTVRGSKTEADAIFCLVGASWSAIHDASSKSELGVWRRARETASSRVMGANYAIENAQRKLREAQADYHAAIDKQLAAEQSLATARKSATERELAVDRALYERDAK